MTAQSQNRRYEMRLPNDRLPIRKWTLRQAPANDRLWPKADHRERLESANNGHSQGLCAMSASGSVSGHWEDASHTAGFDSERSSEIL
jgi:hypothetical protein